MSIGDKTIWIINQYASHLVTRHEELSRAFATQGCQVVVITSSFHHGKRSYLYDNPIVYKELCAGVTYVYLHSGPSYQNNGAGRILNMLDFCRLIAKYQNKIVEKLGIPQFVIASSAPPFVWEVGYGTAKKFHAKFIAEFRDIWPMSLVDVQGVSPRHPLVKLLSILEKRAYIRSDAIVSTMPYAWKHVVEVSNVPKDKIHWMPNGINVSEVEECLNSDLELPRELYDYLTDHWCAVYIGSIVKSECLDYLLRGMSKVKDTDIYLAIIGEGHEKDHIQQIAADMKVDHVRFFPAIDKKLIPKALQAARCCVAAHNDIPLYHYGLSMNKLNDYLISGKPTVFACNADSVVKEAGHFAIPMEEELFANTIIEIKQMDATKLQYLTDSAKGIITSEYDYAVIGRKYSQMLDGL